MKHGQIILISATTTVDFVFFKLQNLLERFDQPTIMADGFMQSRKLCGLTRRHRSAGGIKRLPRSRRRRQAGGDDLPAVTFTRS
jgi:hypothetical protein